MDKNIEQMKKLQSDIRRARKKYDYYKAEYEKARAALENLVTLEAAEQMDIEAVRPKLHHATYYGAFLSGVVRACAKILSEYFDMADGKGLGTANERAALKAVLKLVTKSKLSADRWMTGSENMILEPVARDKKGKPTEYQASWYVTKTVKQKLGQND